MTTPPAEPDRTGTHEMYALRYASMHGRRTSEVFLRQPAQPAEDRPLGMDCYFWVIRSGSHVVLVDSGWNRDRGLPKAGGRYGHVRTEEKDPAGLLARIGITPGSVDHVIVSHMHFDHVGNLDLFPNAALSIARAELLWWTGQYGSHPAIAHSIAPQDIRFIQDCQRAGRVHLVDETQEILPGITVTPVGGHTPGQMIVEARTHAGTIVLASDAAHYHEELDHDRVFYTYSDMPAMLGTYDLLRAKAARPGTWVVTGHDPAEMDRFERVNPDCIDLTRPVT